VEEGVPKELQKRLDGMNWPAMLGSEKFKEWVKEKHLGEKLEDKEITQARQVMRETKIVHLKRWAKKQWGIELGEWQKIRRGHEQPQRRAMIYVSRWRLKAMHKEISCEFGGIGHTAISKQSRLAEAELSRKKGCYCYVQELERFLKCQVQT